MDLLKLLLQGALASLDGLFAIDGVWPYGRLYREVSRKMWRASRLRPSPGGRNRRRPTLCSVGCALGDIEETWNRAGWLNDGAAAADSGRTARSCHRIVSGVQVCELHRCPTRALPLSTPISEYSIYI